MRNYLVAAVLLLVPGCSRAPSINFLGAFFPGWMFCLMGGIALTLLTRALLIRTGRIDQVGPLAVFYPAVGVIFTFLCWLIFF